MALAGAVDGHLTIRRVGRQAGMRLDIGLMHRLGGVGALDDDFGFLEPGFDVALLEGHDLRDIGRLGRLRIDAGGEHVVVQDRRVRCHRRFHVDDVRQHFVLHLDQCQGLIGDFLRRGRDGAQRVAFIKHLGAGHAVQRQIAEVHRPFADERFFRLDIRKIRCRYDREYTLQRLGLAGIDGNDTGMGVGGTQDLPPQHSRRPCIRREHSASRHLVHPVRADRTGANDFQT